MMTQIALPDLHAPAALVLDREHPLTDDEYFAFCEANPDVLIERTSDGEIIILPPAGFESAYRNADLVTQIGKWNEKDGRGKVFGPTVQFMLLDGSALSPDAAWISNERQAQIPRKERRRFPRIAPEFVVEIMSPSDRLRAAQRKMRRWIENGVDVAWLIDPDNRVVHVYRSGQEPPIFHEPDQIEGEGPVEGLAVDLKNVWQGL
ncbi:MAG TPA: Uma2 family endonuclease [Bryobacteraceae bacterium]|nr:Uma2 family endonuclease [Bryobacteraceae bacterium]